MPGGAKWLIAWVKEKGEDSAAGEMERRGKLTASALALSSKYTRIENPRSRERRFVVRCVRLCFAAFGGAPVAGRVLFCGLPGRADILGKGEVLTFTTTRGAGRQNVSDQNDRFSFGFLGSSLTRGKLLLIAMEAGYHSREGLSRGF